ncbi:MAG: PAS domain S-box protein, partial [Methanococcaceae archaeon]
MPVKAHILNIVNNVLYPSFIVESDGKIVSFNCNGEKIIAGNANSNNFFELFVLESSEQIKQIHQSTLNSNSSVCEHLLLHFRNRTQLETEIVASYIEDQGVPFVFYSFNELKDLNPAKGKVNIRVSTKELIEIIHDQKILRIFDEIKSSYPFTFLGKNKIQNEINKINDLFWLKDIEGKFILINQKYAQLLGLKPSQLEGRYEKEFLPKYLVEFFQAGHDFIEDTANILIREGAAFPLSLSNETMQIVEFPLCDLDNRVIAIVGISQISGKLLDNKPASLTVNSEIIYNLPVSLVCLDEQGEVKVASKKFLELFNFSENVTKSNFQEIFPENISHIIADFISNSGELSFIQKKEVEIPGKENLFFVFDLRKIYNGFGNFEFYCIQIEEVSHLENDGLINNREKMYDIIMQTSPEPMFIYDIENLRFLEVNAAALSIYGFTKNEFLQMDLTDLYAPEDIQTLLASS